MKDWALENGATHYTHWFQPLTGSTAEKHDSFYGPTGDGTAIAEFSGKELIQGEPDASSFPDRRHPRHLRGPRLHRLGPDEPGLHPREPQRRAALHPDRVRVLDGRGARPQDPAAALDGRAVEVGHARAQAASATTTSQRVFTTVGPEQEYFLIDEQYYFERPDLMTTGPHAVRRQAAEGPRARRPLLRLDPRARARLHAGDRARAREARRADQDPPQRGRAPAQYEIAPIFENSNVGSDHQQLTMQVMQNVARRYGLVCLLHEKPFAGVNGSGKHNNWSMGTDTGHNLLEPGRHAAREPAVPVLLRGGHPGRQQAPGAAAGVGRQPRPGPPPRGQRGAAGDHLDLPRRRAREGLRRDRVRRGRPSHPGSFLGLGTPVLPPLPMHGGDRNRTSPFAFTGNKFEFRALGSSMSLALPNTVLNTIVAEAIDDLADQARGQARRAAPTSPRR